MAMDWARVEEVFGAVADLSPEERAAYLDGAELAAEDRAEVERLLVQHDKPGSFLDSPILPRRTEAVPAWEAPPAVAEVGRMLGPYKLVRLIGEGGMGAVYLATRDDEEFHREVAVKLIRHRHDSEALVRFRNERQILAGLEHPNIAHLYDGGTDDGRPFLVMEYVEGVRLDTYASRAGLSIAARLRLFVQVCAAVEYAHRNLLVHRDLKPANILVDAEGVPKLLDFGIAKSLEDGRDAGTTRPGQHPMTPAYASPEQVRGKLVTTASDVYSLGVVLYELLTDKSPYQLDDDSNVTLQVAIRDQDPMRPSAAARSDETTGTLARELRGDLDTIVMKALRKEPEHRYASVGALAEDIGRYLEHRPVLAREGALTYRLRKFVRRNRLAVAAGVVVAVVLVGFLVVLARSTEIANRERQLAEQARDRAEHERDRAEQISAFLIDAFKSSDPEQARGQEMTARQILDQGADKVRGSVQDSGMRATLLAAIGEVYVSLGLFDEAEPLLREAYDLRREAGVDEGLTLYQLGELEYWRVDYRAAEGNFRRARARIPEEKTVLRGQVLRGLGLALVWLDRNDEGEAKLTEAMAMLRRHFDEGDSEILRCTEGLAWAARNQGHYAQAEALFREVVASRRPAGPGPALGRSLADLGIVRFHQGALEEARVLLEEALPMLREAMGGDNAYVAEVLGRLVPVLMQLGDDIAAESVIRQILEILPREHPGLGIALHNLGIILTRRGEFNEAAEVANEALRRKRAAFGDTKETALSLCLLGGIALQAGKPVAAQEHYRACASVMEAVEPDHPQMALAVWGVGRSVQSLEGCEVAVPWFRRAFEIWRDGHGPEHYRTATFAGWFGACLGEIGDDTAAEQLLSSSLRILQSQGFAKDDPRICEAAERLRKFYWVRNMKEKLPAAALSSCDE